MDFLSDKFFNIFFTTIFIILIIIFAITIFSVFKIIQEIDNSGGLGKAIGTFIKDINEGIK